MGSDFQTFYDGMTLVGSLVIMVLVVGLTYYASRWYAGRMKGAIAGKYVKILDRVQVSPGCFLAIIQAGDKFYLIGVSDKNIQNLCELENFEPDILQTPQGKSSFEQIFKQFLHRSGTGDTPKDDGGEK